MTHCLITNAIISTVYNRNVVVLNGASAIIQDSEIVGNGTVGGTYVSERAPVYIGGGGTVRRCRIYNNAANGEAGGVIVNNRKLENSLVYNNYNNNANNPGGVLINGASGQLVNTTVTRNSKSGTTTYSGVHRTAGSVINSIMYGNAGTSPGDNYDGVLSSVTYSCAPELTSGTGNVTGNPLFMDATAFNFRLAIGSPALDTGTNLVSITTDIDGTSRSLASDARGIMRHDMGAYEKDGALIEVLEVGFLGYSLAGLNAVTSVFAAAVAGTKTTITWWGWDFDGNGTYNLTGADLAVATNVFGLGYHTISVTVSNSIGDTASVTNLNAVMVVAPDIYVSEDGDHKFPFNSWTDAATNLNDAVDIAQAGCTVHLTNGSYRITKPVDVFTEFTIRSVNGPEETTVWRDASAGHFRMFDLRDANALVTGLTITNSGAVAGSVLNMTAGTVSNCVITACFPGYVSLATLSGGRMADCTITNNSADLGILIASGSVIVENSVIAHNRVGDQPLIQLSSGSIRQSQIFNNRSTWRGYVQVTGSGRLENSLVSNNTNASATVAGGVYLNGGLLINCTITGNSKVGTGSGVNRNTGTITNCIIYGNGVNALDDNYLGNISAVWYSCAPELTADVQGNITSDPLFIDAQFRIGKDSPVVGKGLYDASWMDDAVDLDGNPRTRTGPSSVGKVDMGCYQVDLPPPGTLLIFR